MPPSGILNKLAASSDECVTDLAYDLLRASLEERTTEQTKLATKKSKNSSEKLRTGDKVILQEKT